MGLWEVLDSSPNVDKKEKKTFTCIYIKKKRGKSLANRCSFVMSMGSQLIISSYIVESESVVGAFVFYAWGGVVIHSMTREFVLGWHDTVVGRK